LQGSAYVWTSLYLAEAEPALGFFFSFNVKMSELFSHVFYFFFFLNTSYKVFLNPSTTDVVCTTTAEALAMGKIVVCANHPSNEFFKQFPNCRMYDDNDGFVAATRKALSEEPAPLTDAQRHELSWEAATERFLRATQLDQGGTLRKPSKLSSQKFGSLSFNMKRSLEETSASIHNAVSGAELTRRVFGAIPGTLYPDEELCRELDLPYCLERQRSIA